MLAIAADHAVEGSGLPVFALDDVAGIADFIAGEEGCARESDTAAVSMLRGVLRLHARAMLWAEVAQPREEAEVAAGARSRRRCHRPPVDRNRLPQPISRSGLPATARAS